MSHRYNATSAHSFFTKNLALKDAIERAVNEARAANLFLICGDRGTGKQRLARFIHEPKDGPIIMVASSTASSYDWEREIFGREEKRGLIHAAQSGTIVLNEITDLHRKAQKRLHSLMNSKQFKSLDTTIIATSSVSFEDLCSDKLFANELCVDFHERHFTLPPLRARLDDILPLARHFGQQILSAFANGVELELGPDLEYYLENHPWPENISGLQREMTSATKNAIRKGPFPRKKIHISLIDLSCIGGRTKRISDQPFFEALSEFEKDYMQEMLERTANNISRAAKKSGIARSTLRDKAKRHGLLDKPSETKPRQRVRSKQGNE